MPRVGEHLPPRERRGLCISNPSVYIPVESVPLTRSAYMIADSHPPRQTATALQPNRNKGATDPSFWYLRRRTLFHVQPPLVSAAGRSAPPVAHAPSCRSTQKAALCPHISPLTITSLVRSSH
eukprot:scaffold54706_cov61-Phaeocystis_antarctica.AAC.1